MKTIARAFLLLFILGCGGDDECSPGNGGGAGATCSRDTDCQSCNCVTYEGGEGGYCTAPPSKLVE